MKCFVMTIEKKLLNVRDNFLANNLKLWVTVTCVLARRTRNMCDMKHLLFDTIFGQNKPHVRVTF